MAQSRHSPWRRKMSAFGARSDLARAGRPLSEIFVAHFQILRSHFQTEQGETELATTQRSRRVLRQFGQLAREQSLVPKRSEIRGNSAGISRAIFEFDICRFESWWGSQLKILKIKYYLIALSEAL